MAGYEKQEWVDDVTDVDAERMNHIEEGIVLASKTGGVEVGTIVEWDDSNPIPEGYEVVEENDWIQLYDSDDVAVAKYRKNGNIVEVALGMWMDDGSYNIPAYNTKTLATLPEDCKPSVNITTVPIVTTMDKSIRPLIHFRVSSSGELQIQNWYTELNCQYIGGFISYVV